MAKVIPSDWPLIETHRLGPRQPIVDVPIRDVVRADARLYALAGSRGFGKVYAPAFSTTSLTKTTTTSASGARAEDLDRIWCGTQGRRLDVGGNYLWLVSASLEQLELRVRLIDRDGSALDTETITNSGSRDTVTVVLSTSADDEFGFQLDASATSGTGKLWEIAGVEKILVAADLPLGD